MPVDVTSLVYIVKKHSTLETTASNGTVQIRE